MDVFSYNTYKDFLHGYLEDNKQKGLVSQMAAACGCDRTYLSQVLNSKAELTPDHLIQFCESIALKEIESRYLLLVLLYDRSSSLAAKRSLRLQIDKIKNEAQVLSHKITSQEKPEEIKEEQRTLYYSNWLYGAIHILTSIPALQSAQAIATHLQIPIATAQRVLKDLTEMKLVSKDKDKFIHRGNDVYLPHHFPQSYSHHLNWRMRATERSMVKEDVHYTNVFSISKKDVEKLRHQIVEMIDEQRKKVRASGTDVAYAFCCDFLRSE